MVFSGNNSGHASSAVSGKLVIKGCFDKDAILQILYPNPFLDSMIKISNSCRFNLYKLSKEKPNLIPSFINFLIYSVKPVFSSFLKFPWLLLRLSSFFPTPAFLKNLKLPKFHI